MYIYVILGSGRHCVHKSTACNSDTRSRKSRRCRPRRGPHTVSHEMCEGQLRILYQTPSMCTPFPLSIYVVFRGIDRCTGPRPKQDGAISRRGTTERASPQQPPTRGSLNCNASQCRAYSHLSDPRGPLARPGCEVCYLLTAMVLRFWEGRVVGYGVCVLWRDRPT